MTKANGDNFEGNWIGGKREGKGSYFFRSSGKVIIGEWVNDMPKTAIISDIQLENGAYFRENIASLKIPILELENPN